MSVFRFLLETETNEISRNGRSFSESAMSGSLTPIRQQFPGILYFCSGNSTEHNFHENCIKRFIASTDFSISSRSLKNSTFFMIAFSYALSIIYRDVFPNFFKERFNVYLGGIKKKKRRFLLGGSTRVVLLHFLLQINSPRSRNLLTDLLLLAIIKRKLIIKPSIDYSPSVAAF